MITRTGIEFRRAPVLGMSLEVREAWSKLNRALAAGPLTLLGAPDPRGRVCGGGGRLGVLAVGVDDFAAPTRRVVIPMSGIAPGQRCRWREAGHEAVDLTLPSVKRLHAMKGLLRAEGRRIVVAGFRDDPECQALAGEGVTFVGDADAAAGLPFAPRSALLCQTGLGERRFATIELALRMRHPDSQLVAVDTRCPALVRREKALAGLAVGCDLVVVVAEPSDRTGQALFEAARCLGVPAARIGGADALPPVRGVGRIGITAGIQSTEALIRGVESRLAEACQVGSR